MTKKILSVLLAVVMVLAMGTVALVSVSADKASLPEKEEGYNRYYFYMPDSWINEYTEATGNTAGIYIWEGDLVTSGWPGDPATPADADGVYYVDCPESTTAIIWNNYLDGGSDISMPQYAKAVQTINIGTEYYDPGECDYYPEGTDSFDEMIFVTDYKVTSYNDYSGKMTFGGYWFYYYGDGEYGTTPVKGDSEVMSDPALNMDYDFTEDKGNPDASEPADEPVVTDPVDEPVVTDPVDEPASSGDEESTDSEEPATPVTNITYGTDVKEAQVGDTVTYTMYLTAAELFENIQAVVTYDADKLELVRKTDDPELLEEEIACPVLGDAIFNADVEGVVKFNASKVKGYDFKEEGVLVTLDFVVVAEGDAAITTVIEEMTIKGDGTQSYFSNGEAVITDGITIVETLDVPEHEIPTDPATEPDVSEPETSEPEVSVPAPSEDETSATDAPEVNENDPVTTGVATYIYIAIAMIAMAACAVVVLRKKVNG